LKGTLKCRVYEGMVNRAEGNIGLGGFNLTAVAYMRYYPTEMDLDKIKPVDIKV